MKRAAARFKGERKERRRVRDPATCARLRARRGARADQPNSMQIKLRPETRGELATSGEERTRGARSRPGNIIWAAVVKNSSAGPGAQVMSVALFYFLIMRIYKWGTVCAHSGPDARESQFSALVSRHSRRAVHYQDGTARRNAIKRFVRAHVSLHFASFTASSA